MRRFPITGRRRLQRDVRVTWPNATAQSTPIADAGPVKHLQALRLEISTAGGMMRFEGTMIELTRLVAMRGKTTLAGALGHSYNAWFAGPIVRGDNRGARREAE